MYATQNQPTPRKNDELSAHATFIDKIQKSPLQILTRDIISRQYKGLETYGVPLQPNNGRDSLIDAYQELLDALVYLECKVRETCDPRFERIQSVIAHQCMIIKCLLQPNTCKENNSGIEL